MAWQPRGTGQPEIVEQLRDAGHDPRQAVPVAKEAVATLGGRGIDRTGDDEALPALLERPRRRHQRSAAGAGLDHHDGVGRAADEPVSLRECPLARLDHRCVLGDHRPATVDDGVREPVVRPREEPRVAAADERDGGRALADARGVRRPIDADGETGDHRRPGA